MYWKYAALTRAGNEVKGTEKGYKKEIARRLNERQLEIVYICPDFSTVIRNLFKRKHIISARVLADFFEDFKNMLESGISIEEILYSLGETASDDVLKNAIEKIKVSLHEGSTLAGALSDTSCFPGIVINTLKVGEKTGDLGNVMSDLACFYMREAEIKSNIIKSSVYPLVVFGVLAGVMLFISLKVVPKLKIFLPEQALSNISTKAVLFLTFMVQKGWLVVGIITIFLVIIYSQLKKSKIDKIAAYYYKMPGIGPLAKETAFALFFLNLSTLQRGGISIITALNLIHESFPYSYAARKFLICRDYILGGSAFWQAVERDPFFPRIISYTIRKGEEIGRLDDYFWRLADFYFKKVAQRVDSLVGSLQPILLGACAVFLVLVALSFIVPIYRNLSVIAGGGITGG